MLGTNFSSVAFILASVWLASPLTAVQPNDIRSREAATILERAVVQFEQLPDKPSRTKTEIRSKLVLALVTNRQYDEAESVLDGADDWPAKQQLAYIGKARIDNLADSIGTTALTVEDERRTIEAIKRLSKKSGEHPVSRFGESIDKLLKHDRVELATKIIESSHGDMDNFKVVLSSWGNPHYKMSNFAKIAEYHLRRGNVRSADKIFKQFGQEITRDQARLYVLESCLRKGQEDEAVAETMLEAVDNKDQKYRGAFRLTTYFVHKQNLEKSIQYAEMMDEHFAKSNSQLHLYQAMLLVNITHLTLDKGKNADRWIERAEELAGEDEFVQMHLICVRAFNGDLDPVENSPVVAMKSLALMLNFRPGGGSSYTPLRLMDPERIISCSVEIAESFDAPFLRANALCAVAGKVAKTDKNKAKQIVLSALAAAKEPENPKSIRPSSEFDQTHALQQVANRFAQIGEFKQAIKTIELIPDEPDSRFKSDAVSYTSRELALGKMSRHLNQADSAFMQQNAPEVFAIMDELEKYAPREAGAMLNALTGKFVDLGNWSAAEQLYKQGKESGYTQSLPYQIVVNVAATQNHQRLRKWFDLCDDKYKSGFLQTFCSYFNVRSLVPESRTVIEVESMLKEVSGDESSPSLPVQKFLIVGLWTDGFEDRARTLIDQLEPRKGPLLHRGRESVIRELAIQADKSDLPELATLVAGTIDDPSEIVTYLFNDTYAVRSYERSNKLLRDKQRLDRLPPWVQISLLLRRANELMLRPVDAPND